MCGRFAYFGNGTFGYESLLLTDPPPIEDYNIPPSRNILTIRTSPESGKPDYAMLRWGLVPFWSKTPKTKYLLNNARAEGIEKNLLFVARLNIGAVSSRPRVFMNGCAKGARRRPISSVGPMGVTWPWVAFGTTGKVMMARRLSPAQSLPPRPIN